MLKFSTGPPSSKSQPNTSTSPPDNTPSSSFFSVATGYKLFTFGSRKQPDPDQEGVVWNEPEQYSSIISRKESSRDHASLLVMRDILRQKPLSENLSNGGVSTSVVKGVSNSNAQAVFAKPKTDVTAEVTVTRPDTILAVDPAVLQEPSVVPKSRPSSVKSMKSSAICSVLPDSHPQIDDEKLPSFEGGESEETVRQHDIPLTDPSPPPLPPKEAGLQEVSKVEGTDSSPPAIQTTAPEIVPATSSSFASALAHGINSAVQFIINTESSVSASLSHAKHRHDHLQSDITNIDERPHIKYDWTIGERLKFSCTVYYAKQFDALRRRCGIEDLFLKSLMRSMNWSAEGGKSKSNFWKTSDERFIIKSLVNAWNVADLWVPFHVSRPSRRLISTF